MPNRTLREQLLVERDVQLTLILRAMLYGAACMTYFTVIQYFTQANNRPGSPALETFLSLTDEAIYWVPGFFMLGPLMVYDMLRVTNRVAGPINVLHRELKGLNKGESGRPLRFRNDDYWDSLASEFNSAREELLSLRAENIELRAAAPESAKAESASPESENTETVDLDAVGMPAVGMPTVTG